MKLLIPFLRLNITVLLVIGSILYGGSALSADNSLTIVKNANIIDVIHGVIIKDTDIFITDGWITDISSKDNNQIPPQANIIDVSESYILPGLIDGHSHLSSIPEKCLPIALKNGLTAVRDMAGDGAYLKMLQNAIDAGELNSPDIYFSAVMAGGEIIMNDSRVKLSTPPNYQLGSAPWMRLIETDSDIPKIISDTKDCGATGIKLYAYLSKELVNNLSVEAKKQGLKVWAHWNVFPAGIEDLLDSDVQVVSHIYFLLTPPDWKYRDGSKTLSTVNIDTNRCIQIFKKMHAKSIYLDPTLAVGREMFSSIQDQDKVNNLSEATYYLTGLAYRQGVKISAGTDIFLPKYKEEKLPLLEEIEMLVNKAGLSPIDALRSATIHNANVLGIDSFLGSIEISKKATFLVLGANPLEDIKNIEDLKFVVKNGKIFN